MLAWHLLDAIRKKEGEMKHNLLTYEEYFDMKQLKTNEKPFSFSYSSREVHPPIVVYRY